MRRIILWLMSTVAALVLLFSYRTSTMGSDSTTAAVAGAGDDGTSTGTGDAGTGSESGGTAYQGSVVSTRWGNVQVTITVTDARITSVSVPTYPNSNGRDKQINARALPILKQETIAAQSADIDTVSGATVTSDGFRQSLQAAIVAANLS